MALPPFIEAIGSDHHRSTQEVARATSRQDGLEQAWRLYADRFGGWCGSQMDPQFWRHDHPARALGTVWIPPDAAVVVAGIGPSLARHMPTLKRLRSGVVIFTSLRGAESLYEHGVLPDLAVVEHQTPLDAYVTITQVRDRGRGNILARCPQVAADRRTPRALIDSVPVDRLFVPEPLPTWGLWPATAVALAMNAGARCVVLLGIDLGTPDAPDPLQRPLAGLLSLLAETGGVTCVDCGTEGAPKAGWPGSTLEAIAGSRLTAMKVARRRWAAPEERRTIDRERLDGLGPTIGRARKLLARGLDARAGRRAEGDVPLLRDAVHEMLTWGERASLRVELQDTLGLSMLPRFWRTGIDDGLDGALWRPVVLALHELVHQADALERRLGDASGPRTESVLS